MLELAGLGFAWTPDRWLFRDVTLVVPAGSVTAVLGPNGRGKTTLVRCAAGLLAPVEGTVGSDGPAAFVPQAHGSVFGFTAQDMVLMGRVGHVRPFAAPGRRDRAAAAAAMERVGVAGLASRPFPTLSGGEQQLVLIARAVAAERRTLVLDEPSTGLDLHNQVRVLRLLRELVADGLAVLLTTHHPDHALHVADDVVLMTAADDVRVGPAADLLTGEHLSRLYGVRVRVLGEPGGPRAIVPDYDVPVSPARLPGRSARPARS